MPTIINLEMDYRFTLLKGSKKNFCPSCQKKTFVNYFDNYTKEVLPFEYGRCDREDKCSYHLSPYKNGYSSSFFDNSKSNLINHSIKNFNFLSNRKIDKSPHYFDLETYKKALNPERLEENTFFKNLIKLQNQSSFFFEELLKVFDKYKIGTVTRGNWKGAVTFPYIDLFGNIRTVQVKKFDESNNTTALSKLDKVIISELKKEQRQTPEWLKKHVEFGDEFGYFTCLFGEHLLGLFPENPIALVEAPKTAIYCSLYFGLPKKKDDFIFLAVYNKSSLTFDKIKVLEERKVFVFPDLSTNGDTFKKWQKKSQQFEKQLKNTQFIFSDLLEKYASDEERDNGLDIADFLIKQDWRLFRKNSKNLSESQVVEYHENEQHPPTNDELLKLAQKLIGFNNSKQRTEIPYFEEMMEFRIIKESKPVLGYYYLSKSSPF
jgi:hypothetical protein